MNTNCKKWKYLLCITAVMTAFSSIPFNTQAADQQVKLMNDLDKPHQARWIQHRAGMYSL